MSNEYMFHIRNANLSDIRVMFEVLDVSGEVKSTSELIGLADEMGLTVQDRAHLDALPTARDLGLVTTESIRLTTPGALLGRIDREKPMLFADILHILQYGLWDARQPADNCFSFSYRVLCQELWRSNSSTPLDRKELAATVESVANQSFNRNDIAFSSKSVGGGLNWLHALEPSVLSVDGKQFHRRTFCPPESLLLAIDMVYRHHELSYGANLLLSELNREALAQACLLELSSLDRVLDYTVTQFQFLDKSLGGGWGHFVCLRRPPTLEDFT